MRYRRFFTYPNLFFFFTLLVFAVIFYLVRHFMTSLDEYDNLAAPFLMSRGFKFYLDQFNMHFPLPYYWAYLFSPFWLGLNFSRAISLFRLSLFLIYLFSFIPVFFTFKNTKSKLAFTFWLFLLTIIFPLYHGNLYLSDTFSTVFISSLFWLLLPVILQWEKFSKHHLFLTILFSSLGFWTQPLLGILFIIPLLFINHSQFKFYLISSVFLNLIPVALLLIGNQLPDFINQAVVFNTQIYSHYFPEQIGSLSMMSQNLIVFIPHELTLLTHFNDPVSLFQFISHLAFLVLFVYLIFKKRFRYILAFLLIFVASRLREIKINPGQLFGYPFYPFIAIASSCLFLLFFTFKNKIIKFVVLGVIILSFGVTIRSLTPIIIQSLHSGYNYEVFWSYRQRIGEDIASLTDPSEKILIYPYDSDLYYFSHRLPFDRFIYWYPWINSVVKYHNERFVSLSKSLPVLIYYGNMSYQNNPQAYAQYFPDLLTNYLQVSKNDLPTNIWLLRDPNYRLPAGYSFIKSLP